MMRTKAVLAGVVAALLAVAVAIAAFSVGAFSVQYNQADGRYTSTLPAGFEYDNFTDNTTADEYTGYTQPAVSSDIEKEGCSATDGCKITATTIENDILVAWCQSPTSTSEGDLEFTSSVSEGTWTYKEQSTSYVVGYLTPSSAKTGWDFDCRYTTSNISMTGSVVEATLTGINSVVPLDTAFPVIYTGTGTVPTTEDTTPTNTGVLLLDAVFCDGTSTGGSVGSGWTLVEYEDTETDSALLVEDEVDLDQAGDDFSASGICSSSIAYTEVGLGFDVPFTLEGQCTAARLGTSSYASPVSIPSSDSNAYPVYCLNVETGGYLSTDDVYVNQLVFGSTVSTTDVYALFIQEGVNAAPDEVATIVYFEIPTAPSSTTTFVVLFDGTHAGQADAYGQSWELFACTSSSSCP